MSTPEPMIVGLVTASFAASRETTDRLVENLQATIAAAEAHRLAVEDGVRALLDGDYAPTAAAIQRAVFCPDQALVAYYRQEPTS